jgi:sulfonate transport system permease protein
MRGTRPTRRAGRVRRALRVTGSWLGRFVVQLALPVALVALWWLTSQNSTTFYYPPLSRVVERLQEDWLFEQVGSDLLPSLGRFAAGFLLAAVLGTALGLAIGMSRTLDAYLRPTLEFLRALPAVAVLPVAVFVLGLGSTMRIAVITFGVFFPVLVNATAGARAVRAERVDAARMFGLSRTDIARRVVFPSALPMISAGLRVALPIALIMTVVSELIGGQNGLGYYLSYNQQLFDIPAMLTAIIVLGVIGNLLNALYARVENRVLHWAKHA